ncbi:hypothetical protein KR074_002799 [Drosophila pseudoananassae]|nr:hypothetical protein KR074_002799 [Drosophila pseudoananassae]
MPAAIVIVKQHKQEKQQQHRREGQQQQQQEQRKEQHWGKQICNINLCGFLRRSGADDDVDADVLATAITNITATSSATTATSPAAATSAAKATSRRSVTTKTATTTATRTVIIIMALVVSIIQQQQQQKQQSLLWPFYNGVFVAAAATRQPDDSSVGPTLSTFLSSSESESESLSPPSSSSSSSSSSSTLSFAVATGPQTDATNHTFKSLAFLDASFGSDLFAHQEKEGIREMERKREREREKDTETNSDTNPDSAQSLPIFDFGMPRNITGRTGHTEAIIKCRVDSLHDKSVSWIRKRDLHILTVGTATYTTDKRFQVTESKDSREWTLHVKSPQAKDTGIYECQVNTEPKMSMAFQLNIIEISPDAKAVISGPHDLHFKAGSAIILNCVVQQPSVKDIGPIYWYRGEHMITPFDADDGPEPVLPARGRDRSPDVPEDVSPNDIMSEVDLQKEFATRIAMESQLGDTLKSRLRISNAQTTDTGNYTCQPTTASSASVLVHVINGESVIWSKNT